ncbi:hypothetical protein SMICM17S_11833 [Streptomyces microflavus]
MHVKTAPLRTDKKFTVKLSGTSAVGGKKASAAAVLSAPTGQEAGAGTPGQVQVDITAGSADLTDASVTLQVPAGWKSTPAKVPGRIPAGATRRVAVEVTPVKDAEVRETRLTALARYRAAGDAAPPNSGSRSPYCHRRPPDRPGRATWSGSPRPTATGPPNATAPTGSRGRPTAGH